MQIDATHWFLPQKNANMKPSKKIKKFFSNTTETIAAIIITYIKTGVQKKSKILKEEIEKNEQVAPRQTIARQNLQK